MMTTALALPDETFGALEMEAVAWPDRARQIAITNATEYEAAATFLTGVKALRDEIDRATRPVIEAAHATHKAALAQKRTLDAPLDEAERIVKGTIRAFLDLEERKRREEEARLAAEQRKADEESRLREAEALEQAGEPEAAQQVLEMPVVTPPPVLPPPRVEGVSSRTAWKWKLVDASKVNRDHLMPDEKRINGVVRAMGRDAERIVGGISVYAERVIAAGKR